MYKSYSSDDQVMVLAELQETFSALVTHSLPVFVYIIISLTACVVCTNFCVQVTHCDYVSCLRMFRSVAFSELQKSSLRSSLAVLVDAQHSTTLIFQTFLQKRAVLIRLEISFQSRWPHFRASLESRNPTPYSRLSSSSPFPEYRSVSPLNVLSSPNPFLRISQRPSNRGLYLPFPVVVVAQNQHIRKSNLCLCFHAKNRWYTIGSVLHCFCFKNLFDSASSAHLHLLVVTRGCTDAETSRGASVDVDDSDWSGLCFVGVPPVGTADSFLVFCRQWCSHDKQFPTRSYPNSPPRSVLNSKRIFN